MNFNEDIGVARPGRLVTSKSAGVRSATNGRLPITIPTHNTNPSILFNIKFNGKQKSRR